MSKHDMSASHPLQANERLRRARVARNWRQSDLADQLGTTTVSIKRWERGSHQPGPYYRLKLCALFEMTPQELGLIAESEDTSSDLSASIVPDALEQAIPTLQEDESLALRRNSPVQGQKKRAGYPGRVVLFLVLLGGIVGGVFAGYALVNQERNTSGVKASSTANVSHFNPQLTLNPYSSASSLVLNDNFTDATSNPSQWDISAPGKPYGCFLRNHTYDVSSQGLNYCVAANTNLANFVYQIQLTLLQGHAAGMIFRTNDGDAQTYYIFEITVDGTFFIQRNDSSEADTQLSAGNSPAIHTGFHHANTIAVDANGGRMTFYINGQMITSVIDTTYGSGLIGVIVGEQADTQTITEATYNYARVWT